VNCECFSAQYINHCAVMVPHSMVPHSTFDPSLSDEGTKFLFTPHNVHNNDDSIFSVSQILHFQIEYDDGAIS